MIVAKEKCSFSWFKSPARNRNYSHINGKKLVIAEILVHYFEEWPKFFMVSALMLNRRIQKLSFL